MKLTRIKVAAIYTVMVIFLCLTAFILFHLDYQAWRSKEQEMGQIKLDAVTETVRFIESARQTSKSAYDKHLQDNVRFMSAMLSDFVREGEYTGPRLFEDGAVVAVRGSEVAWPEGIAGGFPSLDAQAVKDGQPIKAGVMLEGAGDSGAAEPIEQEMLFLSSRISGDYYYVDWTSEEELQEKQYAFLDMDEFLHTAAQSFGGVLLRASEEGESARVYANANAPEALEAAGDAMTREMIAQRRMTVQIGGTHNLCVYSEVKEGEWLINVKPLRALIIRCVLHVGMVEVSAFIILATMLHYILSVFRYIKDNTLTKRQARRYHPRSLRRTVIAAGLTGALIIFICTAVFQTLDALHEESIVGSRSINHLFEQLQKVTMDRLDYDKREKEERYIYQGNRIAAMVARYPELGRREKLAEYCRQLDAEFIMLFDSRGREVSCSADYSGFTLDAGLGEQSQDFRRLLVGVPSIAHDVSTDPVTGLTLQYIGVKVPARDMTANAPYGALIMALRPPQKVFDSDEIVRQLHLIDSNNILVCYAQPGTGLIRYANDASLVGKTVMECGMPENSLEDGFTDFVTIGGINSYVTMVKREDIDFYYIIRSDVLFSNTLPASIATTVAYLAQLALLLLICLLKYNEREFRACVGDIEQNDWNVRPGNVRPPSDRDDEAPHGISELLVSRKRSNIRWEKRTPENQVRTILKVDIFLLILFPAILSLYDGGAGVGNSTLIHFLLYGDWKQGLNLFAFCSIILVVVAGMMLLILCNGLFSLIAGFTGKGGETVCRLLYSLVNYIVVLGSLYYVFEYIGLPVSTYIASLSVVSLALSLGAKDMVSDILAGLLIVFENQFQVGDFVEIDGARGEVLEIGVRSTRLLIGASDIKYITNSSIRSIVNKSKRNSSYTMQLTIVTPMTLAQAEALFERELPTIGEGLNMILEGPKVVDIAIMSSGGTQDSKKVLALTIRTGCKERDVYEVMNYVRREIYSLCEREEFEI